MVRRVVLEELLEAITLIERAVGGTHVKAIAAMLRDPPR